MLTDDQIDRLADKFFDQLVARGASYDQAVGCLASFTFALVAHAHGRNAAAQLARQIAHELETSDAIALAMAETRGNA